MSMSMGMGGYGGGAKMSSGGYGGMSSGGSGGGGGYGGGKSGGGDYGGSGGGGQVVQAAVHSKHQIEYRDVPSSGQVQPSKSSSSFVEYILFNFNYLESSM